MKVSLCLQDPQGGGQTGIQSPGEYQDEGDARSSPGAHCIRGWVTLWLTCPPQGCSLIGLVSLKVYLMVVVKMAEKHIKVELMI